MSSLTDNDVSVEATEGYDGCTDLHVLFRDGMCIVNYTRNDEGERISHALPITNAYLTYTNNK